MEYLNRIELTGIVGQCFIGVVGGIRYARFTVATNHVYQDSGHVPVVETDWHQVSAWESKTLSLEGLEKGAKVNLVGRLRNSSFMDAEGNSRSLSEVFAYSLNIIL